MPQFCDSVPSAESTGALIRGEKNALPRVLIHTAGRAALIGVGLAIAGEREHLVRNSLAGAIALEAFLLVYCAARHNDSQT